MKKLIIILTLSLFVFGCTATKQSECQEEGFLKLLNVQNIDEATGRVFKYLDKENGNIIYIYRGYGGISVK